jgi:hypothetical protein
LPMLPHVSVVAKKMWERLLSKLVMAFW